LAADADDTMIDNGLDLILLFPSIKSGGGTREVGSVGSGFLDRVGGGKREIRHGCPMTGEAKIDKPPVISLCLMQKVLDAGG